MPPLHIRSAQSVCFFVIPGVVWGVVLSVRHTGFFVVPGLVWGVVLSVRDTVLENAFRCHICSPLASESWENTQLLPIVHEITLGTLSLGITTVKNTLA